MGYTFASEIQSGFSILQKYVKTSLRTARREMRCSLFYRGVYMLTLKSIHPNEMEEIKKHPDIGCLSAMVYNRD